MKHMFITLKESFQENPKDFIKSIILMVWSFAVLYIAIAIGGN